LGQWPVISAVPENNFAPPSADCRGLWYDGEYFWTAESKDTLGNIYQFDAAGAIVRQILEPAFSGWGVCVVSDVSAVEPGADLPIRRTLLEKNFPNPFNPSTTIEFTLARSARISLDIYDPAGRLVASLVEAALDAGTHRYRWRADGLASGVYYYRLVTPDQVLTRKMVLVR